MKGLVRSMTLHHIALLASQRDRTIEFYRTLGFEVGSSHVRPERDDEIIFMTQGRMTLELFISSGNPSRISNPEAYGLRHLAFSVGDVAKTHERLSRAGYLPEAIRRDTFTNEEMFFIKDPDGTPIEIRE